MTTADEGYVEGDINRVADDEYDDDFDDAFDDAAEEGNVAHGDREEAPLATAVLTHIATSLADEPDQVSVVPEARGRRVTLRLNVAQQDMGRVIGRRGRTAQAIRALVAAAGAKEGLTTSVDIVD
ncbi:MAG TPA: KH domain-containing protein [Acidimicrobiales bacterium]|nr:KH domain-containing protein [Acidimicrobiales bacterium]